MMVSGHEAEVAEQINRVTMILRVSSWTVPPTPVVEVTRDDRSSSTEPLDIVLDGGVRRAERPTIVGPHREQEERLGTGHFDRQSPSAQPHRPIEIGLGIGEPGPTVVASVDAEIPNV